MVMYYLLNHFVLYMSSSFFKCLNFIMPDHYNMYSKPFVSLCNPFIRHKPLYALQTPVLTGLRWKMKIMLWEKEACMIAFEDHRFLHVYCCWQTPTVCSSTQLMYMPSKHTLILIFSITFVFTLVIKESECACIPSALTRPMWERHSTNTVQHLPQDRILSHVCKCQVRAFSFAWYNVFLGFLEVSSGDCFL